ncbi:STAS domain-containing protein [Streptomyces phaeoluteigriseus]|uniref:STAS domain-containing protein n=1 Tax=Streptomyces phaeoluteigriseus TaxID=114686 RepID=UPI003183C072
MTSTGGTRGAVGPPRFTPDALTTPHPYLLDAHGPLRGARQHCHCNVPYVTGSPLVSGTDWPKVRTTGDHPRGDRSAAVTRCSRSSHAAPACGTHPAPDLPPQERGRGGGWSGRDGGQSTNPDQMDDHHVEDVDAHQQPAGLSIVSGTTDGICVLTLAGEIDHHNGDKLRQVLDVPDHVRSRIVVDLGRVTFMESSGSWPPPPHQ